MPTPTRLRTGWSTTRTSSPTTSVCPTDGRSSTSARSACPSGIDSCSVIISSNIKVNQNCLNVSRTAGGGAQAQNETTIAQDPNSPNHILAAWNDYRRGPSNCIAAYSTDKGRTWNDTLPPMAI